jgi:glycosyltransferase involved in cell wall biosynthesis
MPSDTSPLVSVVIPAYKAAPYIRQTLDSVFAQNYPNYEVIVVNDGSPDTSDFESAIHNHLDRIVYLKQENRGPSAARNAGILRARGEFIAFLDSDDLWLDHYLDRQMSALRGEPEYDFIYSDAALVGDNVPPGKTFMQMSPSHGPVTFDNLLALNCIVNLSCTVARRECILKVGLFDERFWHCEDFDLWLRMAFSGARMAYRSEILASHRVRGGSLSATPQSMRKGRKQVYEKILATLSLNDAQRAIATRMRARWGALVELEDGKQLLIQARYGEARTKMRSANSFLRSAKVSAVIALLGVAPRAARWLYKTYLAGDTSYGYSESGDSASHVEY